MKKFNTGWAASWLGGVNASDMRERHAINEAADEIHGLKELSWQVNGNIRKLFQLDIEQGKEIDRLRATLNVVVQMLLETKGFDESAFGYRIEAALAELEPEAPVPPAGAAPSGHPYREGQAPAAAPAAEKTTVCVICHLQIPVSRSNVTERGDLCDRCLATMPT